MRADEIMSRDVITVGPQETIADAANIMINNRISGLPVVDANHSLIGIVSEADFVRRLEIGTQHDHSRWLDLFLDPRRAAVEFAHERGRKVAEIMTTNPLTIAEDTSLGTIADLMESRRIKRLPVLCNGRLVGIITRANLVQAVAAHCDYASAPMLDDARIRDDVMAAIQRSRWSPRRLNVIVTGGIASIFGIVSDNQARRATIVAAENVPGVRTVRDRLSEFPDPEEDLGGGDFASLQYEPCTTDDAPL